MLVDSHCHLGAEQFDADRDAVVRRAAAAGVGHVVVVADTEPASRQAIALAREYGWSATAGVHPHAASTWTPEVSAAVVAHLDAEETVAVGETGLDYHYDYSPRPAQRRAFAEQLDLGARHHLPVVVHSRDADDDMVAILKDTEATVILHSFSSGPTVLETALDRRAYVSFSGMVTFKSWTALDAVRAVPDDRLLVETDAPYLAPTPHRGQRNEPAFVQEVARRVAAIREVDPDTLTAQTVKNAVQCFGPRITQSART